MRQTSRSFNIMLLASVLAITPSASVAALATTASSDNLAFCSSLKAKNQTVSSALQAKQAKVTEAWANQDTKLVNLKDAVDTKIMATRVTTNQKLKQSYTALEAKASTDTQKTAVTSYETTVQAALAAHRESYDAARATFRQNIDASLTTRRASAKSQADVFIQTVSDATQAATVLCSSTKPAKAGLGADWVEKLRTAKETYNVPRANDGKISDSVKQFAKQRSAALQAADKVFHASLQAAANELRSVLPSSAGSKN